MIEWFKRWGGWLLGIVLAAATFGFVRRKREPFHYPEQQRRRDQEHVAAALRENLQAARDADVATAERFVKAAEATRDRKKREAESVKGMHISDVERELKERLAQRRAGGALLLLALLLPSPALASEPVCFSETEVRQLHVIENEHREQVKEIADLQSANDRKNAAIAKSKAIEESLAVELAVSRAEGEEMQRDLMLWEAGRRWRIGLAVGGVVGGLVVGGVVAARAVR